MLTTEKIALASAYSISGRTRLLCALAAKAPTPWLPCQNRRAFRFVHGYWHFARGFADGNCEVLSFAAPLLLEIVLVRAELRKFATAVCSYRLAGKPYPTARQHVPDQIAPSNGIKIPPEPAVGFC